MLVMTFTPRAYRKGDVIEVAMTVGEETALIFDGWLLDELPVPAADPHRHVEVIELATLPELKTASVAALEDADEVSPTGAWDFAQAPTVAGDPIGGLTEDQAALLDGATDLQTPNTLVLRDGNGNVSGTGIYGNSGSFTGPVIGTHSPTTPNEFTRKDYVDRHYNLGTPITTGDFDTLQTPGTYACLAGAMTNQPGIGSGVLEVFSWIGVITQRLTGVDTGQIATRRLFSGTWSAWKITAVVA